jgi:rSAM/selenodomain-associated transferase 2
MRAANARIDAPSGDLRKNLATVRLSIIIPTLDESDTIGELLSDLSSLRPDGAEVIVADGGSIDGTPGLAAETVDRVLLAPRGRAAQMNAGAKAASGDLFWFLHADTRVPAEAVVELREAIDAGASWGRFDVRLSGSQPLLRLVELGMNLRSRLTKLATGDQGIFVTRALFERIGGIPPIMLMEDIALSTLLRRVTGPACLSTRLITSSRRWETNGVVRTILMMWGLRLAYALGADPGRLARAYARGRLGRCSSPSGRRSGNVLEEYPG